MPGRLGLRVTDADKLLIVGLLLCAAGAIAYCQIDPNGFYSAADAAREAREERELRYNHRQHDPHGRYAAPGW